MHWPFSEPQDYPATIQCLVDNGADISLSLRIGQDDSTETLSPLEMAKRCQAEEEVIRLLAGGTSMNPAEEEEGDEIESSTETPIYNQMEEFCFFCFSVSRLLNTYLLPEGKSSPQPAFLPLWRYLAGFVLSTLKLIFCDQFIVHIRDSV